jgi:hypothetical protein
MKLMETVACQINARTQKLGERSRKTVRSDAAGNNGMGQISKTPEG